MEENRIAFLHGEVHWLDFIKALNLYVGLVDRVLEKDNVLRVRMGVLRLPLGFHAVEGQLYGCLGQQKDNRFRALLYQPPSNTPRFALKAGRGSKSDPENVTQAFPLILVKESSKSSHKHPRYLRLYFNCNGRRLTFRTTLPP